MAEKILPSGQLLHYLDARPSTAEGANGRTVLLLHGLGATGDSWALQIPALKGAGFRVLAPDARGFGRSPYTSRGGSIRTMAADFAELLAALQIETADVAGISMGGTHALQLALDYPQRVKHLALINTFAALRPRSASQLYYFLLRLFLVHTVGLEKQAQAVAIRLFPGPGVEQAELRRLLIEQITQANPAGYRAAMRALARFNVTRRLGEIRCPTLVVTGAQDSTVSPRIQGQLASGITGAQQVDIPAAGHAASVEQPEYFNRILLDFLNSADAHFTAAEPGYNKAMP